MYVDVQRTSLRRVLPATFSLTTGQRPICSLTPRRPPRPGHPCAVYFFVLLLLSGLLSPAVSQRSSATTPSSFYPFRQDSGDNATAKLDDGGSGRISLLQSFPFFAKRHNKLYVNNNGVISFLQDLRVYRPEDFPLKDETPLIAPYWADVDVSVGGTVWYRQTRNAAILSRATQDVHTYSSAYKRFQAKWVFIATWDQVGFYGAIKDGANKRNTFQCVLVSDGTLSFVIINYARIEWTTGSNSHGTPETGLGGNPAQAGFNAGDGINFYEIEGAGTDSVINLTLTSNVCIPGRWIFRVDSPEIQGDSGDLFLTPSSGNMLGGYEVEMTGPCFDATSVVKGLIVETDTMFPCVEKSGSTRTVVCVMPTLFRVGPVTVSIIVDGQRWNYTGDFTLVNPGVVDTRVIRHSPGRWRANQGTVRVSWKSNLFPSQGEKKVLVEVMAFRYQQGEEPQLVSTGQEFTVSNNNNNNVRLQLPPLTNATLAVIRVKIQHMLINESYLSHWSDVFPVRWSNPADSDIWCSQWLSQEQPIGGLTHEAACPCTLKQAESDTGRWQRDPLCSSESSAQYNCIYRGSRAHECIVPTFKGSETVNQRCCYSSDDNLLNVRDGGGGSIRERYHFRSQGFQVVPWFSYLQEDVASFLHCCDYASNASLCEDFLKLREPVSCQGYNPPAAAQAAGDPHIVTLDGVNYTFNGAGDFVLIQDDTERIRVHVHASRAIDIDNQPGNATVFTAVAMSVVNETEVVEIRKDTDELVAVLINQREVDFTSTQRELRGMTIYRNETGNGTVEFTVVMDTAGISVLVSATEDLLNIMVLVGNADLKDKLKGLLGNYNGVKEDDFRPPHGPPIPITSNMSDVHYLFGMTWYLESNETLLYHPETDFQDDSPENVSESSFVPVFFDTLKDEDLRNGTRELCQGNLQCIFDYQLTGSEGIAKSTKQFNDRFESVIKEIAPVIRCPYVQQITNGNRTLEGQAVGQKVRFICNPGFVTTNGSSTLMCLPTGRWNSTAPDCVKDMTNPKMFEFDYIAIGGGVGGFIFVIVLVLLIRYAVLRYQRKYIPKSSQDAGSEVEQSIELPTLFHPSETPNPVFENPLFLTSLQKLRSDEGKFQIPRPRYVDPNIYTEYF